ncbi:PQQ-binding-like beta-propeller repeat protein [Streptomyces sp. NPDC088762]|uniref:outer membrane protein assembly factor BamB family protein n=1 Tax=Streptomyces sp. NPDC088762 TaxID=3365891 RepID=UPI0038107438
MSTYVMWERPLHQQGDPRTVAVADDCVVVHERFSRLVCLEREDGSVRWDHPFGRWPRAVVAADGRCYGIAQDVDALSCRDLRSGAELWRAPLPGFTGHVAVAGDTVLVGGWRGYTPLQAFDTATGRPVWRTPRPVDTVLPLGLGDGTALLGAPGGAEVRRIRLGDGSRAERVPLPGMLPDGDDRAVFSRAGGGRVLLCCDGGPVTELRFRTGARGFRTGTRARTLPVSGAAGPVSEAGGLLWLSGPKGFDVLDPADGTPLWRVEAGHRMAEGVVPVADGFLVAGTQGTLFRLGPTGEVAERMTLGRRVAGLLPGFPAGAAGPAARAGQAFALTKGTLVALRAPGEAGEAGEAGDTAVARGD